MSSLLMQSYINITVDKIIIEMFRIELGSIIDLYLSFIIVKLYCDMDIRNTNELKNIDFVSLLYFGNVNLKNTSV